MTFDEEDLWWKPLMEDNLQWKMAFDGRQPLLEDDL